MPGSHAIPYAGRWRGKSEVTQFFTRLDQTTEPAPFEPREFIPLGDTVVVLGYYGGRVKASGRATAPRTATRRGCCSRSPRAAPRR